MQKKRNTRKIKLLSLLKKNYKERPIKTKILIYFLTIALIASRFIEIKSSEKLKDLSENLYKGDKREIVKISLIYVCYIIAACLMSNLSVYFLVPIFKGATTTSAVSQIGNVLSMSFLDFHRSGFSEYAARINRSSSAMSDLYETLLCKMLPTFFLLLFTSLQFMVFFGKFVAFLFIINSTLFIFLSYKLISNRMTYKIKLNRKENQITNTLTEKFRNRDTVVTLNLKESEMNDSKVLYLKLQHYITRFAQAVHSTSIWQEFIFRAFFFFVVYYCVVFNSKLSLIQRGPELMMATTTLNAVWKHLTTVGLTIHLWLKAEIDIGNGCLEEPIMEKDDKLEIGGIKKIELCDIKLQNCDNIIFDGLSATIEKPISIAIAGKNGAGKSTLIKLLMRFFDYDGDILINGVNLREISKKSFFRSVSYSSQDPHLFDDTILKNIQYGNGASFNEIEELAKKFDMHDHILSKKNGYLKNVGYFGNRLSGGEKQKIIILRTILKDADIFLFDEPTANIDKKSESKIIIKILEVLKPKIVIAVVHNIDLLCLFDKVLFIDNKKVKAIGNHNELLEKDPVYRNYFHRTLKVMNSDKK